MPEAWQTLTEPACYARWVLLCACLALHDTITITGSVFCSTSSFVSFFVVENCCFLILFVVLYTCCAGLRLTRQLNAFGKMFYKNLLFPPSLCSCFMFLKFFSLVSTVSTRFLGMVNKGFTPNRRFTTTFLLPFMLLFDHIILSIVLLFAGLAGEYNCHTSKINISSHITVIERIHHKVGAMKVGFRWTLACRPEPVA